MYNKYLLIRDLRDKLVLKSKNGKIKIYSNLAKILDKKLNKKFKYTKIKLPSNYDLKHIMDSNPQFELLKDREVRCATRNSFYISDIDEKINKVSISFRKHKIISRMVDNNIIRNSFFTGMNVGSIILSYLIDGTLEPIYLNSSLLLSLPITTYCSIESKHNCDFIDNIDKYEIINKMEVLYQKVINEFCLFIYQLKIKNPLDIMFVYDATISRLCLLVKDLPNDEYKEAVEHIENEINRGLDSYTTRTLGYNVLLGYGVCRNQATIFKDICTRLNMKSSVCSLMYNGNEDYEYHSITLVEKKGKKYLLDPENLANYKIVGNKLISEEDNIVLSKITDYKTKRSAKKLGFNVLDNKINEVEYMSNISKLYQSLMDDVMIKRICKFNNYMDKHYIEFNELFHQLLELDNNKIKTL